jgi:hypothetical protein
MNDSAGNNNIPTRGDIAGDNRSAGNKRVARSNDSDGDSRSAGNNNITGSGDVYENIDVYLHQLQACRRKLKSVDDDELDALDQDRQEEWAWDLHEISVAITRLETARLMALSEEFIEKEPELCEAASRLKEDLQDLDRAAQIICAVSDGLKTITTIAGIVQRMKMAARTKAAFPKA